MKETNSQTQIASIDSVSKINLFLKVRSSVENKNFKGYHEIYTLFYPLPQLADTISIKEGDFRIFCNHTSVPTDESNLIFQAVKIFERESSVKVNLQFSIDKKIPVAGGMAGGSSNAGTVIRFLNSHFEKQLKQKFSTQQLIKLCTEIGADVSFFLNPEMTLASGIGNIFEQIPKIHFSLPLLIFTFDFGISAKWAYEKFAEQNKNQKIKQNKELFSKEEIINILKSNEIEKIITLIDNDLSLAIFENYPSLRVLKEILYENNALKVEISGSGPSMFAVFKNFQQRDLAKKKIDKKLYKEIKAL